MKSNVILSLLAVIALGLIPSVPIFAQAPPQLSDAQIAKVAVDANQIDIDYAELAMKKSQNPEVREFAHTMIADHGAIIDQAVALVTKLGVKPEDNGVSQSLLKQAKETKTKFKSQKGKNFDEAYINNEVAYHKAVIEAVKTVLIPQSKNAELKALLETALPILETHLKHAEMAQRKIVK